MTDYFAANDLAALITTAGSPTEVTTAGHFDSVYTTKAISLNNTSTNKSAQFIDPTTGANVSLSGMWLHFELFPTISGSTATPVTVLDAAGAPVFRISFATAAARLDYWNGSAFVNGASTFSLGANALKVFDLHLVSGALGTADLYINNSPVLSLASMNAAVDNFAFLSLSGVGSTGQQMDFSQIVVSDVSTVGAKVASLVPNANSAVNTAWTNDYTNLVKTGLNDATLVSDATLNDKESYGATDVTLPTSQYFVSSVWFAARARLNSAAPANIKPLMRIGGADYSGAYNFGGLSSVSFGPSIAAFPTDPSTAAAWAGVSNLNAAELGFITQT